MKKALLSLSLVMLCAFYGFAPAFSQDQPRPQKDTVNIDTDAKPKTYYDVEDDDRNASGKEKGSAGTIAIIFGAMVVVGAAAFFLLKKR